ncbi:hypothetical protein Pla52o_15040 [Novipirellula galeiformis]|uniref:Uncharacterized protein n=1 Tax=Novipirellula galeiformis TaxID=2528004 RepID=A0A5C6CQ43_9BACT|nr:hypothetical protein Pla52o_15040 [Novipirellula galeiformis]
MRGGSRSTESKNHWGACKRFTQDRKSIPWTCLQPQTRCGTPLSSAPYHKELESVITDVIEERSAGKEEWTVETCERTGL